MLMTLVSCGLLRANTAAAAEPTEAKTPATQSFVYVNGGVGASYMGLTTFNSSSLALGNAAGSGAVVDVGAGLRLVLFTFGPRVRYHALSTFDMWQVNLELALHVPVRHWDGYVGIHGGYSFVGKLTRAALSDASSPTPTEDLRVRGLDVGLQLGLDYCINRFVSLGAEVSGEVLYVRRPALATTKDAQFGIAGGGLGFGATGAVHAGVHF